MSKFKKTSFFMIKVVKKSHVLWYVAPNLSIMVLKFYRTSHLCILSMNLLIILKHRVYVKFLII